MRLAPRALRVYAVQGDLEHAMDSSARQCAQRMAAPRGAPCCNCTWAHWSGTPVATNPRPRAFRLARRSERGTTRLLRFGCRNGV